MGNKSDKVSTQESSPWEGQQPFLRDIFSQAQGLFDQGPQQYYPGQTVAPFSPQTQLGMDLTTQRALGGSQQQNQFGNYLSQQFGQQNFDPASIGQYGYQAAGGIGQGQNMLAQAGANPLAGGGPGAGGGLGEAQPNAGSLPATAANQLAGTAGGQYLGSNPYLDQMFNTASSRAGEAFNEQTLPGIAAMFGSGGRTGGGIQQEVVGNAARQFGRDLQGMAGDIYAPSYEAERGRQVQAAQMGGQYDLGNRGLGIQAGGQLGQLGIQGMGQLGNLYGQIGQNQFNAGQLMPSYNQMGYNDIQQLMNVGAMNEDQAQRYMGANQNRWNFAQQAPWQNLGQYSQAIYGMPGQYGTQTTSQPGGSRLGGMIGGGLAGFAAGGPWGAAAGALGGGMG